MSEEARVSSVFPEVRSAGGAKIKVEALLLKSGIGGCTCTSTRAHRAAALSTHWRERVRVLLRLCSATPLCDSNILTRL